MCTIRIQNCCSHNDSTASHNVLTLSLVGSFFNKLDNQLVLWMAIINFQSKLRRRSAFHLNPIHLPGWFSYVIHWDKLKNCIFPLQNLGACGARCQSGSKAYCKFKYLDYMQWYRPFLKHEGWCLTLTCFFSSFHLKTNHKYICMYFSPHETILSSPVMCHVTCLPVGGTRFQISLSDM